MGDPQLQAVYRVGDYIPDYPPISPPPYYQKKGLAPLGNEETAYELARRFSQPLPYAVNRLTREDLVEIATFKPTTTWHEYLKYKEMSLDKLLEEFPELNLFSSPANLEGEDISWSDAFHYATRGKLRHAPNAQRQIERHQQYQKLGDIGKALLNTLFDNDVNYALSSEPHPLEQYIIGFDTHIADSGTIIALGDRMGFTIIDNKDYSVQDQFIDLLMDHINKVEKPNIINKSGELEKKHRPTRYPSSIPSTKEMININRPEFDKMIVNYGQTPSPELYRNRLTMLPQLHERATFKNI